jgi:hypothetical protein
MIGHLSKHPPIALHVLGSREAIDYLRQDSSNFARRVQCSGKVGVHVSGEERILSSKPSILFSYFPLEFLSLPAITAAKVVLFSIHSFVRGFPISKASSREMGCAGSCSPAS